MSTKAAVAKEKPDYAGELWSGQSATTWPLASITLQIFLGFRKARWARFISVNGPMVCGSQ